LFFFKKYFLDLEKKLIKNKKFKYNFVKIEMKSKDKKPKSASPIEEEDEGNPSDELSSNLFEEEVEQLILLKDSKNPQVFLTKTAAAFIFYFMICASVNLFLIFDMRTAKQAARTMRVEKTFWFLLGASLLIKILFSLVGDKFRSFAKFAYLIDCVITFFFMLGLYFWLDERLRQYYLYEGYYVIIIGFTLLANSIFYLISTLVKNKRKQYSTIYGFVLMSLSTIITLFLISKLYGDTNITIGKYVVTFVCFSVFNLYICKGTQLLFRFYKDKLYEHEFVYAFFILWGFFAGYFWVYLVKDTSAYKKYKRKKQIARKNAKEEAEKKKNKKDSVNRPSVANVPVKNSKGDLKEENNSEIEKDVESGKNSQSN
jgi:hypothetical protein